MAFDKETRNLLAKTVTACRRRLIEDVTDQLRGVFGLHRDGTVLPLEKLTHLTPDKVTAARRLRDLLDHYAVGASGSPQELRRAAYERTVLEISFTALNRLAALRLCEERGLVIECVRKGTASDGFRLFERISDGALGTRYDAYRVFLECMFDELALDLGVLFDRLTPQSAVFPTERCLEDVLAELNKPELTHLWTEDETIGWIYQYFNPPEERKAMREASQAPRNSRELAVRNQFFTPRYVVEFLTDNTLGRIWYEMRKGDTSLKNECRYLVRRPNEVFLGPGGEAPDPDGADGNLSQEELLKKPVYIEPRPKKDPRDLRILDPASGSCHFLLYAFDLLETIYAEAWEDRGLPASEATGRTLREDYASLDELRRAVPELILRHNLHGIDIDPRAVQIGALALWLRAQKSWQTQGLKAAERPRITKSNIVCAEPMPGEEDLRREFTAALQPRVLGQLVELIFEKLKLVGEAGSLLKIEEEIQEAVARAKGQWLKAPQPEQAVLFPEMMQHKPEQRELFEVKDITDEEFWHQAEERIFEALKEYSEQAENGHTRRRLFAEDAARGFAFIDLCRKRYDVVLMNPPFGLAPRAVFNIHRRIYADSYVELYAQMVTRGTEVLNANGRLGAISSRSFMTISRLRQYRRKVILPRIALLADLGASVMDDAFVESAAYIVAERPDSNILAIDLRGFGEPQPKLIENIANLAGSDRSDMWVIKNRQMITNLPDGKLLYSLPLRVHTLLGGEQVLEPEIATVRQGMGTFNDFRFLRLRQEVAVLEIHREGWEPLAKGGAFSFYYSDIHLLLNWKDDGAELSAVNISQNGQDAQVRQASEYWRRAGLTYSKRSQKGFSTRALPAECIIAGKGPAILSQSDVPATYLLGWVNSRFIRWIIEIQANDHEYNTGIVKKVPWVEASPVNCELTERTLNAVRSLQFARAVNETNSCFLLIFDPGSLKKSIKKWNDINRDAEAALSNAMADWDVFIDHLYGVDSKGLQFDDRDNDATRQEEDDEQENESPIIENESADNAVGVMIGIIFGRWDVRIASDQSLSPNLPDPFEPLPVCPPGMLVGPDGLPAKSGGIVSKEWLRARPDVNTLPPEGAVNNPTVPDSDYPLRISWEGVLVDDPGFNGAPPHRDDVVRRVREVLDLLWKDKAPDIEQEACDILGVSDLRDYFRKPSGFFQDHLKRYSKSRRKAPIYWPLSTASGSYTVWLYYHRLTDQTLYAVVNQYVEPKIAEVERGLARIEDQIPSASGRDAAQLRDRLHEGRTFLGELRDFREELLSVAALPYKPNLNDGVIINAAPLHKLFRLRSWASETEECWKKLQKGDYDWAHLAYTIWPDRVQEVCKKDRSIAIAHGLEDLCEVKAPAAKQKGGRRKKESAE